MGKISDLYNEMKQKNPKHIVFMHIGDFYETYDADARVCKEVLGLTLNQRNGKAQLITGFPNHAYSAYISQLHNAGYNICICEDFKKEKISNNNQTTTTMETNFAKVKVINVYWFNREREALVKLVLLRQSFRIPSGKATYEWAEADGDREKVVLVTQYDPQEPDMLPRFYKTVEDFEKGVTIGKDDLYWMRSESDICEELLSGRYCRRTYTDEKGVYIWAYIKGQAVKWYFNKHIDVVTLHCVDGCINARATADAEAPENYFNAEEVYKYNDWTEIRKDGERIRHEGVYNRLRLEPDQELLADKLQEAIDACKAAGMKVYFNLASYDLNVVNVRHVERIEYDPSVDEETERRYVFEDRVGRSFRGICDLNTDGGDVEFVIKK